MEKKTLAKLTAASIFSALFVVALVMLVIVNSFTLFECVNTVETEIPSPDGTTTFVLYERDCGATTSVSTHGMILKTSKKLPNEAGNTFVFDQSRVTAAWTSNTSLSITYPQDTRVYHQNTFIDGISVNYRKQKP